MRIEERYSHYKIQHSSTTKQSNGLPIGLNISGFGSKIVTDWVVCVNEKGGKEKYRIYCSHLTDHTCYWFENEIGNKFQIADKSDIEKLDLKISVQKLIEFIQSKNFFVLADISKLKIGRDEEPLRLADLKNNTWISSKPFLEEVHHFTSAIEAIRHLKDNKISMKHFVLEEYSSNGDLVAFIEF
jgi:hypothetical protein